MPSTSRPASRARLGVQRSTPSRERAIAEVGDSLRQEIKLLIARRQSLYERVQTQRQSGQVVPTSLCDALNENTLRLRVALNLYVDTTTRH